jgi:hypothetical protein
MVFGSLGARLICMGNEALGGAQPPSAHVTATCCGLVIEAEPRGGLIRQVYFCLGELLHIVQGIQGVNPKQRAKLTAQRPIMIS